MKKLICLILLLALAAAPALAETPGFGEPLKEGDLTVTLQSASVLDTWAGETSATHAWIVVELTAQTFATQPVALPDALQATLTYQGKYAYDAALEFGEEELEPLVALPGKLVFRVPLLVAQADPAELQFAITCAGVQHPVALDYAPVPDASAQGTFFDQPEDAILFLVDHVKQGDFAGALNAGAAGSMAEAYQFGPFLERIMCVSSAITMPLPSSYESYVELNRMSARDSLRRQLTGMIQSLLIDPGFVDGTLRRIKDSQFNVTQSRTMTVDEYIRQLDPARLKDLTVQAIYRLNSDAYNSEQNKKNIQRTGAVYGFTASQDFVMVYELSGQFYLHTCTAVRFEKGWQIMYLNSALLATSSLGGAAFATEADAQALETSGDYVKVYPQS
jgi:hypothetical protein